MHFLYLVGEVEKGDLLMVSLEWMMHIMGGMHCVGGIRCFSWGTLPLPWAQCLQLTRAAPCKGRPAVSSRGDALMHLH
jgi:hypothetical protein